MSVGFDPRGRSLQRLQILSRIAIVKTVGGIVFPSHPLATPVDELAKTTAGYGKDMSANIAEAKRLLKEAGHSNLKFTLNNRGVDQPYRVVGTWLIDQWKKAGITVEQRVQPTTPFYATLRKQKRFRRFDRLQLPSGCEPDRRRVEVPADRR